MPKNVTTSSRWFFFFVIPWFALAPHGVRAATPNVGDFLKLDFSSRRPAREGRDAGPTVRLYFLFWQRVEIERDRAEALELLTSIQTLPVGFREELKRVFEDESFSLDYRWMQIGFFLNLLRVSVLTRASAERDPRVKDLASDEGKDWTAWSAARKGHGFLDRETELWQLRFELAGLLLAPLVEPAMKNGKRFEWQTFAETIARAVEGIGTPESAALAIDSARKSGLRKVLGFSPLVLWCAAMVAIDPDEVPTGGKAVKPIRSYLKTEWRVTKLRQFLERRLGALIRPSPPLPGRAGTGSR